MWINVQYWKNTKIYIYLVSYILILTLSVATFLTLCLAFQVKLAKHIPTGKEVAIKIIDKTQVET